MLQDTNTHVSFLGSISLTRKSHYYQRLCPRFRRVSKAGEAREFSLEAPSRVEQSEGQRGATSVLYKGPNPSVPGPSAFPVKQGKLAFLSAHRDSRDQSSVTRAPSSPHCARMQAAQPPSKQPGPVPRASEHTHIQRRKWQPTSVFLPGKSHEQRSLAGYPLATRMET